MPYSDERKIFWYTPARIASRSCIPILNFLKFSSPNNHNFFSESEHASYYLVCNVRNPYTRLVSLYELLSSDSQGDMKDIRDFEMWLESKLDVEKPLKRYEWWNLYIFNEFIRLKIKPNYLVKIESLYENILNVPFIKNEMTDELNILVSTEIKQNNYSQERKVEKKWYEYYNQKTADLVSKNLEYEFEMFNYNTNYWKDGTP